MKKFLLPFVLGLILGLCGAFFIKENEQIEQGEHTPIISGEISLNNKTYYDTIGKEAQERIDNPYTVQAQSTNRTDVTINIPRFFSLRKSEKEVFLERIQKIGKYQVYLNIEGDAPVDTENIREIFREITGDFTNLTISFYGYPKNTYDIFEPISWIASENMRVSLMLFGPKFPLGFDIGEFLRKINLMIAKNNQGTQIAFLGLSFSPNIDGMHITLTDDGEKILQNIQTRYLWTDKIQLNTTDTFINPLKGKERLIDFFKTSPVEKIEMNGVGQKEGNKIIIDGF